MAFTASSWSTGKTIEVKADWDGKVTGDRFLSIVATVATTSASTGLPVSRTGGAVTGGTGRADEIVFGGALLAADSLRGLRVLITGGKGAGQLLWIEGNTVVDGKNVLDVQGDFDVVPDTTSTFTVIGYDAPGESRDVVRKVTRLSPDRSTITVGGAVLPIANGGLAGALIRVVGKTGSAYYKVVASNTETTITITDEWGNDEQGAATIVPDVSEIVVVDVPGLRIEDLPALVHDAGTAGVVVRESDGSTRLVEGATGALHGALDEFYVRLTQAPDGTITIRLAPIKTRSMDLSQGAKDCGGNFNDPSKGQGCDLVQVEFVAQSGQSIASDGSLVLTFTTSNWMTEQKVVVRAINDTIVDGSDLQSFADAARRTHLVQGPLTVSGGDDPFPPVPLTLDGYLPVLLPGEVSGHPTPIGAVTADEREAAQIDTLVIHNEDSPAGTPGTLTSDQLTGLDMGGARTLSGVPMRAGIVYSDMEDLTILLGYGDDDLTVESTHGGTTTIDAGPGEDTIRIRTIDGHTRVLGGSQSDSFLIGKDGLLDLLKAVLVIDGGTDPDGLDKDVARIDDSADDNDNLGHLDGRSLTGLDMTARILGDALGRPLDQVFHVVPTRNGGTFTLVLTQTRGGVTTGLGGVTLAVGATADQVRSALQKLLFPPSTGALEDRAMRCGTQDTSECSASVYVWTTGDGYLIGFRGEVNELPTAPVTIGLVAIGGALTPAYDALRRDGIVYDGLETLNLLLGKGSDVLNVRGTRPVTNVSFGLGDDRVYISSRADVGLAQKPQFLAGDLDDVLGTLNLDLGSGRHTLLVSDEASSRPDTAVLMTDVRQAAADRDAAVKAGETLFGDAQEIYLVGLSTGSITWRAAADGTFNDGIRVWAGSGADTITVDGTHRRAGTRTTTWLNTGLGSDRLVVRLTNDQDGFFVLNTQGPNDNLLRLTLDLRDGDGPVQADSLGIRVNGTTLDPQRYVVNSREDTHRSLRLLHAGCGRERRHQAGPLRGPHRAPRHDDL